LKLGEVKEKNILFLQGPMGNFFKNVAIYLEKKGANTFFLGFNLADWFFSYKNYTAYKGKVEDFEEFFERFLEKNRIDKICLLGDCRIYHKKAIKIANKKRIDVYVFEEGYVRPDFVTCEKWGVNNFSLIPRKKEFYENLKEIDIKKIKPANPSFFKMALSATIYYILAYIGKIFYPNYIHHRDLNPFKEAFFGLRNLYRKYKYKVIEKNKLQKIVNLKYFFVPLQTASDFQIKVHSKYDSIEEFIKEVLISFSKHAPKDTYIVIKHHPMDRGRYDYKKFIKRLSKELGIEKRVIVVYDLHLPTLLKNTLGCVTINSTVGLQAMYHNAAVKVLGEAIYDIDGLSDKKNLDEFWKNPTKPNKELFNKFRAYLINNTQINGSFYGYFNYDEL